MKKNTDNKEAYTNDFTKKFKKPQNTAAISMALCMIAAALIIVYMSLSHTYAMKGEITQAFPAYFADAAGYEYDMEQYERDGFLSLRMTTEDPWIILSHPEMSEKKIGGVELKYELKSAPGEAGELTVQVFYSKGGNGFSERNSKKMKISPEADVCHIPLPCAVYDTVRIDFDADFELKEINLCSGAMETASYVSAGTIKKCICYIPLAVIGIWLIFAAHRLNASRLGVQGGAYFKTVLFGKEPSGDRQTHLDYIRILASVLVILAHSCSPMVELADSGWKRLVLVCGLSLGLCCNLLYVMLSGALLLNPSGKKSGQQPSDEGVGAFYMRRASRVVIPLVSYYLLLLALNSEISFLPPEGILSAFSRIVTGAPDAAPHLWLIYVIVALYIATPFLRLLTSNMSRRMMTSLFAVIITLNILTSCLPLFGMKFGAESFLAGWEGVFLLGYILSEVFRPREKTKNNENTCYYILIALGVIAYIVMVALVYRDASNMSYVYGSNTSILIASMAIFAFFIKNSGRFSKKQGLLVRLCSKYSYSIILIHWYALFVVVQGRFHVTALRFGCLGGIAASVALTYIVCFILAFVFDNSVVIVVNMLFDRLCAAFTRLFKKKGANMG